MSLEILSGPEALHLVSLFTQLSYISQVNCVLICAFCDLLLSSVRPSSVCHGYFRITHMHVPGWFMMSSQMGACLWNDVCWV